MKLTSVIAYGAMGIATCLPGAATAQASGIYVGGAIGQADMKQGCDGLPAGLNCDKKDTGWKAFAGYQFTQNWGIEGEYVDFGKTKANGTFLGLPTSADVKVNGWGLVGTGTLPLSPKFDLFGKLGVFWANVDSHASVGGGSASVSGHSAKETFGAGARWNFSKNWSARLEWERFSKVGDSNTTGTSDVDFFSVGLAYKF
jgi:OOP family OmpA-OmpF porin